MKKLLPILFIVFNLFPLEAQIEEMINPSDLKQKTIITEPATLSKGFFRTGITSSYGVVDRVFDESGKRSYILGTSGWYTSWECKLGLQYGLLNRVEILLDLPYQYNRNYYTQFTDAPGPDSTFLYATKAVGNGLGDIGVGAEFQIIVEDAVKPSLSAKVFVTLPTGQKNPENLKSLWEYDMPTGSGVTTIDIRLKLRKIIYPYSFTFYGFYLYYFEGSKILALIDEEETRFKNGNKLELGGSFNLHLNDWIALTNDFSFFKNRDDEFYGITTADEGISNRWGINYQPSLVFQIRRFRFFEAIQLPVYGKNYVPADPLYVLGLQYTF